MAIWIMVVLFFAAFVFLPVYSSIAGKRVDLPGWPAAVGVAIIIIVMIILISYLAGEKTVLTPIPGTEKTYRRELGMIDEHYLVQKDEKFLFWDKTESPSTGTCEIATSNSVVCYNSGGIPYVIIEETNNERIHKWWFFYAIDSPQKTVQYEFHIPSRDYIAFAFEEG